MAWEWKLTKEQCISCGICADVCSHKALKMTRDMAYPESTGVGCEGCMLCAEQCPVQAIEVWQLAPALSG